MPLGSEKGPLGMGRVVGCSVNLLVKCIQVTTDGKEISITYVHCCLYCRNYTKSLFNAQFGSIFRTYHNPTYFSRRLARFADLYMSNVRNLLNYPIEHTFYPRRMELPHEPHD